MTPLSRYASSPQGDNICGPAKPVPRCSRLVSLDYPMPLPWPF